MHSEPPVIVLLATYNGAKFLQQQLDSLLGQRWQNLTILARDDGSTDSTVEILLNYQSTNPDKVRLVQGGGSNLGASGSFSALLQHALGHSGDPALQADYFLFCDQDDVWLPGKIDTQMSAMQKLASQHPGKPLLVHSDLEVVNAEGEPIAPSLAAYQGLETHRNRFPNLIISNLVTGCTALFNRPLAELALPVPADAIMHDWWMALVASAFGALSFVDEPLVRYRQHGENTIGAKRHIKGGETLVDALRRATNLAPNVHLQEVARQAGAFRRVYGERLSREQTSALRKCERMASGIGVIQRAHYKRARQL